MAMNGSDILILIDMNIVGSQRDASREETTEEIDVSSKDGRARRVLPGRYKATLNLDALFVPDNAAYLSLVAANRNGTFVDVVITDDGIAWESAYAIVTSISESYPDQVEAVISVSLTIDGEWVSGS